MSEEKCNNYCGLMYCDKNKFEVFCKKNKLKCSYILEQQLQTAKDEKQDCVDVIKEVIKISGANECDEVTGSLLCEHIQYLVDENKKLTQQNKQMRENINNIKNLCNEDWEDMTVDKFQNQLLQALKGGE